MRSHRIFRDSGHVIQTRRQRSWPWVLVACLAVLGLLAIGHARDARDDLVDQLQPLDLAQQEAARMAAYELGRAKGHAEMVATAKAAWDAAELEAHHCARRQP